MAKDNNPTRPVGLEKGEEMNILRRLIHRSPLYIVLLDMAMKRGKRELADAEEAILFGRLWYNLNLRQAKTR